MSNLPPLETSAGWHRAPAAIRRPAPNTVTDRTGEDDDTFAEDCTDECPEDCMADHKGEQ